MSNYFTRAIRPYGTEFEDVIMIDDYFGKHEYGVQFSDGQVYSPEECKFN